MDQKGILDVIFVALPELDQCVISNLLGKLGELGVETADDMKLLEESDLKTTLKPIQIRKLLRKTVNAADDRKQTLSSDACSSYSDNSSQSAASSSSSESPAMMFSKGGNKDLLWPTKIKIPLQNAPELKTVLSKNKRPDSDLRRYLVRLIVDEVRKITLHGTKHQFEILAQTIVTQYPDSLKDQIDGKVIGSGYDSLAKQLIARNENLNRAGKTKSRLGENHKQTEQTGRPEPKQRKVDSYGCVNWSSNLDPKQEEEALTAKEKLQELWGISPSTIDWAEVNTLMETTYALQRKEINAGHSVEDILKDWPFLTEESIFLHHVMTLVGIDVREAVCKAYEMKASRLIKYFKTCKTSKNEEITSFFIEAKQQKETNVQALLPAVILCIIVTLGEEESGLFFVVDETSSKADIEKLNTENWPRLAMHGDTVLASKKFSLVVDGKAVCDTTSFLSALSLLFSSYYIFNIEYPREAAATLEFIQRCFVGINPDKSKLSRKKKSSSVNPKVLRLINNLADFEWASAADPRE